MDVLQLKMKPDDITKVIQSIDRDLDANPDHEDATALTGIVTWLRYRVAKSQITPPAPPRG